MASKKRKAKEPLPEPLAADDPVGTTDQDDGEKEEDDEAEVDVRLLRSVVHDEYTQTSEKKDFRKGGKKEICCDIEVMKRVKKS